MSRPDPILTGIGTRLRLTQEGRKKEEIVKRLMEKANKEFLNEFNESEEVALRTLLNRIILRA